MTTKHLSAAAAALLILPAVSTQAHAQTRAATLSHGPAIPGVCVFSTEAALQSSLVGKAAEARMQQLRAQASAELSGEQSALQTDAKALEARRGSLSQAQLQQQAAPLQQRAETLNKKANDRSSELEYTARHQMSRINQVMQPIVQAVYQQRHCSLLLSGDAVLGANPAMDITEPVVQQLNSRMTTISFDREAPPATAQ